MLKLHHLVDDIVCTEALTPELAEHVATPPPDPEFQQRVDELGLLTNEEPSIFITMRFGT